MGKGYLGARIIGRFENAISHSCMMCRREMSGRREKNLIINKSQVKLERRRLSILDS